jgi:hypothetical protein
MIEKNIRLQPHHARDLLVGRRSDGRRPGYQPPGHRDAPAPSRGGGGGGGRDVMPVYSAPAPAAPITRDVVPTRAPITRDVVPTRTLGPVYDYEGEAYDTPDTIASLTPGPSPHGDRQANIEEQKKLTMQQLIAKQQEEKYGVGADPTKFGETISDIDRVMSKPEDERTIDDKLTIEEWEKEQDWEKVEELADRGESFEDIQAAMNKGLLLKEDAIRRQGLIERGLAAVMPKTKLESSLLNNLKSKFDPKSMIGNIAKNFALRKLGLGWLNPFLGLASLFFPGKTAAAKEKIASYIPGRKPKDMSAFSDLGLYADRQPTDKTYQARVGDAYRQPISTQIAKGTGLQSGAELLGLKKRDDLSDIKEHRADVSANDGRIDRPLAGRSRYI